MNTNNEFCSLVKQMNMNKTNEYEQMSRPFTNVHDECSVMWSFMFICVHDGCDCWKYDTLVICERLVMCPFMFISQCTFMCICLCLWTFVCFHLYSWTCVYVLLRSWSVNEQFTNMFISLMNNTNKKSYSVNVLEHVHAHP